MHWTWTLLAQPAAEAVAAGPPWRLIALGGGGILFFLLIVSAWRAQTERKAKMDARRKADEWAQKEAEARRAQQEEAKGRIEAEAKTGEAAAVVQQTLEDAERSKQAAVKAKEEAGKLAQQLEQAREKLQQLEGQLQQARRETVKAQQAAETARKEATQLKQAAARAQPAAPAKTSPVAELAKAPAPAPAVEPAKPAPPPPAARPTGRRTALAAMPTDPRKILVVEDSATLRRAYQLVLMEPFALTLLDSGDQAVSKAREVKPDLVIVDLSLNGKDGYEICRELRSDAELKDVPVLLMHSPNAPLDEPRAQEVKASDHMAKPFDSNELIEKVVALSG